MKFGAMLKSAVLFPVLVLGIQGAAFAGEAGAMTGHAIGAPHDGASGMATGKRQHKPFTVTRQAGKSSPDPAGSLSAGEATPQPVGLLLPAVQKVREAAAR